MRRLLAFCTFALLSTPSDAQQNARTSADLRPAIAIRDLQFAAQLSPEDARELNSWAGLAVLLGRGDGGRVDAQTNMDLLAKQLTSLLTDAIVSTESFTLFEREQLTAVTAEQDLGQSKRAQPAQATAQTGQIQTAQYVVTGSITKFGKSEKKKGGAAAIFGGIVKGAVGVGLESSSTDYEIGITLKIVDASSSRIIATIKTEGAAKGNASRRVAGAGMLGAVVGGVFSSSATGEREKRLAEAMEAAAVAAANAMSSKRAQGVFNPHGVQ